MAAASPGPPYLPAGAGTSVSPAQTPMVNFSIVGVNKMFVFSAMNCWRHACRNGCETSPIVEVHANVSCTIVGYMHATRNVIMGIVFRRLPILLTLCLAMHRKYEPHHSCNVCTGVQLDYTHVTLGEAAP